ncbi:MAG TPA: hypothetical protein VFC16_16670, partial [Nakamurella sp.]|nr:hypothetical protein [Nakamurella sp.]
MDSGETVHGGGDVARPGGVGGQRERMAALVAAVPAVSSARGGGCQASAPRAGRGDPGQRPGRGNR